jgi:hypothetical protein
MSTAGGHPEDGADALAEPLGSASFAHIVSHADGDSVAAAGVLGRALAARNVPYQVSVARTPADTDRRLDGAEGTTVALGLRAPTVDAEARAAPSAAAFGAVRKLSGAEIDPALTLAGGLAAGRPPGSERVPAGGFERRPGVAVPVADLADGLAHSTLLRAAWSGETDRARAALAELGLPAELGDGARTKLASAVAIDATDDAPPRAAESVERALRPHVGGPFETLGGYADVLECLARAAPGTATALALGHGVREAALDAWREHAAAAHAALDAADGARYAGVCVYHGTPVWTLARLAREFDSPEPAALAVGKEAVALATTGRDARATLADEAPGGAAGRSTLAYAETDTPEELAERTVSAL